MSYLVRLCYEAAARMYGSITGRVEIRLQQEFRLIERNGMAGLLLLYREIALLAHEIMEERGLVGPLRNDLPVGDAARQWRCWRAIWSA